ncbi:MAG: hypothetical protein CM15mP22_5580 [Gammaproteobacteria bacterium]|nr:MAG: hypothetical protein CM15mP22_5580 [Gammaproteobacteria bacterium]
MGGALMSENYDSDSIKVLKGLRRKKNSNVYRRSGEGTGLHPKVFEV